MKDQCRRCGLHIEEGLRCKKCRSRVDEELRGEISRPFDYYFRWWNKKRKSIAILYSNLIKHG